MVSGQVVGTLGQRGRRGAEQQRVALGAAGLAFVFDGLLLGLGSSFQAALVPKVGGHLGQAFA